MLDLSVPERSVYLYVYIIAGLWFTQVYYQLMLLQGASCTITRSEERRVGKGV